ncbi:MAG: IPT/TIG domain-containing protein [Niabella sp.]
MKNLFVFIAVLLLITSCQKDKINQPAPLTLSSISPLQGIKGTVVTINGSGFGSDASMVEVFFNGKAAQVSTVSQTQIKAIVPAKAFSGKVSVKVKGITVEGSQFNYIMSEYVVSTFAGNSMGFADGAGAAAKFNTPSGIAMGKDGNLYVADRANHKIRKITPDGVVSTLAGGAAGYYDGVGGAAKFDVPLGIAVDTNNNVYVADFNNHAIRKITPNGQVTTVAGGIGGGWQDGTATVAKFYTPFALSVTGDGTIYVADWGNNLLRRIATNGYVSTLTNPLSGYADGLPAVARFRGITGLALNPQGELLMVDNGNHAIRKFNTTNHISTFAGGSKGATDGAGNAAQFNFPYGITMAPNGDAYVSDIYNHKIRKITPAGNVTTIAGTSMGMEDGPAATAKFNEPNGIALDKDGNIYVADFSNHRIRKIEQQ